MKRGDRVLVSGGCCPLDLGAAVEATLLFHPLEENIDGDYGRMTNALVAFDEGSEEYDEAWAAEDHLPNDHPMYERAKGKRCWWIEDLSAIAISPLTNKAVKSSGGHCTICNEFNEYQDGPYVCYVHRH